MKALLITASLLLAVPALAQNQPTENEGGTCVVLLPRPMVGAQTDKPEFAQVWVKTPSMTGDGPCMILKEGKPKEHHK